jgi:hypothetical protein
MSKKPISSESETDWERLDAMTDEEIDLSDCSEITPEQFAKAVVRCGLPDSKNKSQGQGYQTQINSLLRAYMEAHH